MHHAAFRASVRITLGGLLLCTFTKDGKHTLMCTFTKDGKHTLLCTFTKDGKHTLMCTTPCTTPNNREGKSMDHVPSR